MSQLMLMNPQKDITKTIKGLVDYAEKKGIDIPSNIRSMYPSQNKLLEISKIINTQETTVAASNQLTITAVEKDAKKKQQCMIKGVVELVPVTVNPEIGALEAVKSNPLENPVTDKVWQAALVSVGNASAIAFGVDWIDQEVSKKLLEKATKANDAKAAENAQIYSKLVAIGAGVGATMVEASFAPDEEYQKLFVYSGVAGVATKVVGLGKILYDRFIKKTSSTPNTNNTNTNNTNTNNTNTNNTNTNNTNNLKWPDDVTMDTYIYMDENGKYYRENALTGEKVYALSGFDRNKVRQAFLARKLNGSVATPMRKNSSDMPWWN